MKSFFALATAFALAIVPLAIGQPTPATRPVRFDSALVVGGAIGVAPAPGSRVLILATPGDGNLTTFLVPVQPALGGIQIMVDGYPPSVGPFCVSGTPPTNRSIASVERCNANDAQQLWTINGTIANNAGLCLSVLDGGSNVILSIPCSNPPRAGDLWNTVPVSV